ncbi:MAG TPA: ATP synthase F1 subunit gamma [Clostridiales bacterium]|jgi:F-type H+-transporting ATPase subunit gamma|nr:ATP synthase F1 subunit gamma [Clostridiales bacterium]
MAESSMKDISLRIRSIKSTKQITKAMELVASSKLSKAKERIEKSRLFHTIVYNAMDDIIANNEEMSSPYLFRKDIKKSCYIVIAGDRGLAGGYNSNVFRFSTEQIGNKNINILPIGKRAVEFYRRQNYEIVTDEYSIIENLNIGSCHEIGNLLTDCYLKEEIDELYVIYTKFLSTLTQQPEIIKLLPLDHSITENQDIGKNSNRENILFEPSSGVVFNSIVPSYISGMLWSAVSESLASEFGARRTAMESASKNAQEMIDDLSLKYNRARQGSITQEITEIIAGSGL